MVFQKIIQNDQKSVVFVMNSLVTRIICWKTTVKHSQFFSLNLYKILSGGFGWSSPTITAFKTLQTCLHGIV